MPRPMNPQQLQPHSCTPNWCICVPGEDVFVKKSCLDVAYLRATVLEVLKGGYYRVRLTELGEDVKVFHHQIVKFNQEPDRNYTSFSSQKDATWGNLFSNLGQLEKSNTFFSERRDPQPLSPPNRENWKMVSPRRTPFHNFNMMYNSPKKSSLFDNRPKKPSSPLYHHSPQMQLLENCLKNIMDSPLPGRIPELSMMHSFHKSPGNKRIFPTNFPPRSAGVEPALHNNNNRLPAKNNELSRSSSRPSHAMAGQLVWSGDLPPKDVSDSKYSRKVFLGGVPWDITDHDLENTFGRFGSLDVEWPPTKNGQKPKGYVYIVFNDSSSVVNLLDYCNLLRSRMFPGYVSDGTIYKYHVKSDKMKSKEIQVIPWNINDSTKVIGPQDKVNMRNQVFVGGLHGMLTATGLSNVMNDLFGNVVYVEIDTDKYKYPLGSGRVNFSSEDSYHAAIHGKYVQVKSGKPKIDKRIQIDPYIKENEGCSKCLEGSGPLYCRTCFVYYCEGCWEWHVRDSPVKHEWVSRTRNGKPA